MSAIVLQGIAPKPTISIAPDAEQKKRALLGAAEGVKAVVTQGGVEHAVDLARRIREMCKVVEESRKAIKAPVLTLGKDIDQAAQTFVAELEAEAARLTKLAGAYQAEQERKAREEAQAKQRELDRIEKERQEAERKAREEAASKVPAKMSLEDLDRIAREEEAALEHANRQAQAAKETVLMAPTAAPAPKATGLVSRAVKRWEVTDIRALYAAHPELVKLEPRPLAISEAVKQGINLPGVRTWDDVHSYVRS